MMAKNIQRCMKCNEKLLEKFRMVLMMGPQGYRRYPVCMKHVAEPPKTGGRQMAKALAVKK